MSEIKKTSSSPELPSSNKPFDPVVAGRQMFDSKESVERAVPQLPDPSLKHEWSLKRHVVQSINQMDKMASSTIKKVSQRAEQLGFHSKIGHKKG